MKLLRVTASRFRIVSEFFSFLWQQKLYWLIAVSVILLLLGLLALLASSTPLGPWIYPLL